jgi:transposase
MQKVARTIRPYWDGVVAYLRTRITNGPAAELNVIIQTAKRKARDFKTIKYFSAIIYLTSSHLQFDLPNPISITHTNSH